uniref:Response regulator n=1 Tax=Desulfacinum infernum TaxID=35837 RepID=A0A832A757_9BACT
MFLCRPSRRNGPERLEEELMATKAKILIVDDDADFAKSTKMILLADGYEVIIASDGKEGLRKVQEEKPDLIILDIMMESIFEGFSLVTSVRSDPRLAAFKNIPILMVSSVRSDTGSRFAFGDAEDMGSLSEPDDYLDKPFKPKELLERVADLLARRRSS